MKIVIATGGTGGHIFTGLAIAEELESKGVQVMVVGSKFGMERKIVKDKYPLKLTWQKPLSRLRRGIKDKLEFPLFLGCSFIQSMYILAKEQPSGVIGTGGFGSFSIVFIGALFGVPTIITEIDSLPGLTTRILARFVFEVWLAFESAKNRLPLHKIKVIGFPVRKEIMRVTKTIADFGLSPNKQTILVFGGSRGAHKINEVVKKTIELLPAYQFIWQTGSWKTEDRRQEIEYRNVWRTEFIEDMGSVYGNAALVVARAGALTIGELATVGLPAILIPYPYATGGHQLVNAKTLEKKGAVKVILEKELTPKLLANEIDKIIKDKGVQTKMKKAIKKFSNPDAANLIAKRIMSLCR